MRTLSRRAVAVLAAAGVVIAALPRPTYAQRTPSPGAPEWLAETVNAVRLGVRLEGELYRNGVSVAPLEERELRFLGRPVQSRLPATGPMYGVSAGLRVAGAEVRGTARANLGVPAGGGLRWQSGEVAVPARHEIWQWSLRAQYFFFERVGLGVVYQSRWASIRQVFPTPIPGEDVNLGLFSGHAGDRTVALYVPMRFRLTSRMHLLGRVGGSVYGTGEDDYSTSFARHQKHPNRPDREPEESVADIGARDTGANRQFARVGVARRVWSVTGRLFLHVERVDTGAATEAWNGGVRLELGLPF